MRSIIFRVKTSKVFAIQNCIVSTNCVPILKMLLDKGANLTLEDGTTVFQIWARQGQTKGERIDTWSIATPGYTKWGVTMPDWITNLSDDINRPYAEMLSAILEIDHDIMKKGTPNPTGITELHAV